MSATTIDPQTLRETQLIMLKMLKKVDEICRKNDISYWLDSGTLLGAVRHKGFIPWDDDVDICMLRDDYEKFLKIAPSLLTEKYFLQNVDTDIFFTVLYTKIRDNNSLFVEYCELNEKILYHQGIFIDIFPVDKLSSSVLVQRLWKSIVTDRAYSIFSKIARYRRRLKECPFRHRLRTLLFLKLFGRYNLRTLDYIDKLVRRFTTIDSNDPNHFVISYGYALQYLYKFKGTHTYDTIFPLKEIMFEDAKFLAPCDTERYLKNEYGNYMQLPDEKERYSHSALIITDLKKSKI